MYFRFTECLFATSTMLTGSVYLLWPLLNKKNIKLPLNSWVPYDIQSKQLFWITYMYQCCAVYLEGFLFISSESLLAILMQHICNQLELLTNRLFKISNLRRTKCIKIDIYQEECNIVKDCVDHHIRIFS